MRILIVDDEANKCAKMLNFIQQRGIQYDIAETLNEAKELFANTQYNAVILDRNFPIEKGGEKIGAAGEMLLAIMEEQGIKIPVLIHSSMLGEVKHPLVHSHMLPWDYHKLSKFLDDI